MVNPINYILDVPDPLQSVMGGFEAGTAIRRQPLLEQREATEFGQQQTLFAQGQEDRETRLAAAAEAKTRAKQMLADMQVLNDNVNATSADYASFIAKYPEASEQMQASWRLLDDANKESTFRSLSEVSAYISNGRMDLAEQLLADREKALITDGRTDEAAGVAALYMTLQANPTNAQTTVNLAMAAVDPDKFQSVYGNISGPKVQSSKPFDNGAVLSVMSDGSTQVTNPEGIVVTGEEAARVLKEAGASRVEQEEAITAARERGKLDIRVELGGTVAQVKALGELAGKLVGDNLASFNKVNTNVANYSKAIEIIDSGDVTGALERYLPNISAASIELENVRNRLGLDVIGSVAFGALSEGERQMAMDTALPIGLDGPELRKWLVEKRNAQRKASIALYEAAAFLSVEGNSVSDYLKTIAPTQTGQPTPTPPTDANAEAAAFFGGGS